MNDTKNSFLDIYDSLVADIMNSDYSTMEDNMVRWLEFVETEQPIQGAIEGLGPRLSADEWKAQYIRQSPERGAILWWPPRPKKLLSAQLNLIRIFSARDWPMFDFTLSFLEKYNIQRDLVVALKKLFRPIAASMRQFIEECWPDDLVATVPAADRVVRLDHNSHRYANAVEALETTKSAVAASNEYDDLNDQKQRIAELSASLELLRAPQVDAGGFFAVAKRCLRYLADKFVGGIIGKLAIAAIAQLSALLGLHL